MVPDQHYPPSVVSVPIVRYGIEMPPKLVSDEALTERISEVFRTEGYEGASISQLQRVSGLGRSSLYHRFPNGKEDMAVSILEATTSHFVTVIFADDQTSSASATSSRSVEQRLNQIGRRLTDFYRGGSLSCLLETLTLGTPTKRIADLCNQAMHTWIGAFAALSIESGHKPQAANERAIDAVAAIEGALVVARSTGSSDVFERTMRSLPERLLLPREQTTH